ncbi:uncharacterized protein TNCV_1848881 [Trichonephila clavipes]|nr:uncharacterized protein TNCV_1848881 [Trichonephila clavipes]
MAHRSKEPRYRRSCLHQTRQLTPTTVDIRESHGNVPHEPVVTTNSFSDLESEEIKNQVETEEIKTAELPKPKPPYPIHLKIKDNFRNQLKQIYQNFPNITNKTSGELIKLFTKDHDQHHKLRQFLEKNKEFEFFSVQPKPNKPIKVVIKGLPIFTKTQEIQSDLEEDGFTVDKLLNKLKNAEDSNSKACILVEALLDKE